MQGCIIHKTLGTRSGAVGRDRAFTESERVDLLSQLARGHDWSLDVVEWTEWEEEQAAPPYPVATPPPGPHVAAPPRDRAAEVDVALADLDTATTLPAIKAATKKALEALRP